MKCIKISYCREKEIDCPYFYITDYGLDKPNPVCGHFDLMALSIKDRIIENPKTDIPDFCPLEDLKEKG